MLGSFPFGVGCACLALLLQFMTAMALRSQGGDALGRRTACLEPSLIGLGDAAAGILRPSDSRAGRVARRHQAVWQAPTEGEER
jgi:hypothetical protein